MNYNRRGLWPLQRYLTLIQRFTLLSAFFLVFGSAESRSQAAAPTRLELGQLFLFGFPKPVLDATTLDQIRRTRPGAFILFKRNMTTNRQTAELTNQLQLLSQLQTRLPAFIALDQEGGPVIRLPFSPAMPSPWALGQTGDPALAKRFGETVGRALRRLGFNMNLAPVLDLGSEQKSFVGTRALSPNAQQVANLGVAFAEGLLASGIIPVAKHFPGMGAVINDPHQSLVRRSVSSTELFGADLIPFRNFSLLQPSGIMLTHLIYPALDRSLTPAVYSHPIVTDLLLRDLGYRGLVISDDLMMEGSITQQTHRTIETFKERIVKAFEAGVDLIMVSWSRARQRAAEQAIAEAMQSGRLQANDVAARIEKIRTIKHWLTTERPAEAIDNQKLLAYGMKDYQQMVEQIFEKNFQSQSDAIDDLPPAKLRSIAIFPHQQWLLPIFKRWLPRVRIVTNQPTTQKSLAVLFVRTPEDKQIAASLSAAALNHTLIINQIRPSVLGYKFPHEMQIFMSYRKIYDRVASLLAQKSQPPSTDQ